MFEMSEVEIACFLACQCKGLSIRRVGIYQQSKSADAILTGGGEELLKTHRRDVTVVFLDLRGFAAFTDSAEPEEVMAVLGDYHRDMDELVVAHQGTIVHWWAMVR